MMTDPSVIADQRTNSREIAKAFRALVSRARNGSETAIWELPEFLDRHETLARWLGSNCRSLENRRVKTLAGGSQLRHESLKQSVARIRKMLKFDGDGAFAAFLVHLVVYSHLDLRMKNERGPVTFDACALARRDSRVHQAENRHAKCVDGLRRYRLSLGRSPVTL